MTAISLILGKPMRKDSSCINVLTCEHYIKSLLSEVPYNKLFEGIHGNGNFLVTDDNTGKVIPVTYDYLLEPNNWISNNLLNKLGGQSLFKNIKNICKLVLMPKFVCVYVTIRVVKWCKHKQTCKFVYGYVQP